MKLYIPCTLLVISIFWFASCKTESIADKSFTPKSYTIEQLYANLAVIPNGINKDDNKILVSDNSTGIFNVYEINAADNNKTAITHSAKESTFGIDYIPGSNEILYSADLGGDENDHLYSLKPGDSLSKDLTPWAGSKNSFGGWSKDKKSMYVLSNKRNPKLFDLYKMKLADGSSTLFFQNDSAYSISTMSNSERYIGLTKSITTDKNEIFLYNRVNKELKKLSNDNEASWNIDAIENNDSILYYTSNDENEFARLFKYHIANGLVEPFYSDQWDVAGMSLSENEKYHTIFINEDGKNKLLLFEHATGKPVELPAIPDANINSVIVSNSENKLLLNIGSSTSPNNLYLYDVKNKEMKKMTSTLNPEIEESDLVKAEVIQFKSFDGLEIPAIYYKPHVANKNHKVGALVWVHGGPGGQSRVGFSNSIQYLVNHGYAVLAVNNRGRSGYGKKFFKMDNKDHGGADLKDCVWGKKWLAAQDFIDTTAIGIYGGSYGGCMVLNALTTYPEEFKAGVNLFGVANWIRTLRSIPPYWESFRKALYEEMGDPFSNDSVMLKNTSPLFNYQKINKPLIVFQGSNDVRVLQVESDEIVAGVKKNGVPVEYVLFPDEGHGFVKKENQMTTSKKTLEFLDKYLKTEAKVSN
ncbi:MAG: alpha/beta fold hydrolase [Saprospiraceae bacterium]